MHTSSSAFRRSEPRQGPHCAYVKAQGLETKHPVLGCHPKKTFGVKELARHRPRCLRARLASAPAPDAAPPAQVKIAPALKWTPTDLAKMAERNSPYTIQDIFAMFMERHRLA